MPNLYAYSQRPQTMVDLHMVNFSISSVWIKHEGPGSYHIDNHDNQAHIIKFQANLMHTKPISQNLI